MSETLSRLTPSKHEMHLVTIDSREDANVCKKIAQECTADARWARVEAVGKGTLAVVGLAGIALVAAKIAAWVLGFVLLPMKFLAPSLFGFVSTSCEVGAGGGAAYLAAKKGYKHAASSIANSWERADKSYEYAARARAREATLLQS